MAHRVSPETTVYVRGAGGGGGGGGAAGSAAAGSGAGAGAGASSAAGTTSGAAASGAGGGGSAVSVFEDQAGPSLAYSTTLRSSCSTSLTSLAPLVSVCQTGLSGV